MTPAIMAEMEYIQDAILRYPILRRDNQRERFIIIIIWKQGFVFLTWAGHYANQHDETLRSHVGGVNAAAYGKIDFYYGVDHISEITGCYALL